jgi:hypothetical protein
MSNLSWPELHLNYITHYGAVGSFRRSSITITGSTYTLSKWYKGCGFNPETVDYQSLEDAKKAGENWYHKGV